MKIALFPSAFHPSLGGVEELSRQLAHELKRRGNEVIILTNLWPRNLPAFEEFEGLKLYRIPFRMPEPMLKARLNHWLTGWWMKRQVISILRKHKVDLLHVQCVSSNAHYALEAGKWLGIPVVATLQGELTMDANQVFQRSSLAKETLRRAMSEATLVTACSAKTLRDAEAFTQVKTGGRGRVIYNAASMGDFSRAAAYQHHKPYLFALGRMVPQKGFDHLLRAFAAARCQHDLILAGDGDELPRLRTLARDLNLKDRVHFVGRADRQSVTAYFKGSDFVVVPSAADEGLPVVCAEAMAAGRAVVTTDSGGAPEAIVDGINGLVVPKGDVAALCQAIINMSERDEFRGCAAAANLERARLFSWQIVTDEYETMYRDAQATFSQRIA